MSLKNTALLPIARHALCFLSFLPERDSSDYIQSVFLSGLGLLVSRAAGKLVAVCILCIFINRNEVYTLL